MPLASFQRAAATDPLEAHTLEAIAAGVSTRGYARTLDPVPREVEERTTSRSSVSRRFVALSTARLRAFLGRPLGELGLRVVGIDGKVFRDHCIVIALGVDTEGRNHVLGLREGATETAAVATGLLNNLVTRGAADGPDDAVPGRWRSGAAPGHHGHLRAVGAHPTLSGDAGWMRSVAKNGRPSESVCRSTMIMKSGH